MELKPCPFCGGDADRDLIDEINWLHAELQGAEDELRKAMKPRARIIELVEELSDLVGGSSPCKP